MSFVQDISQAKVAGVDPAHFRKVLGHVPTSVSIATACDAEGPFGIVLGSLVSISLDPPLVGVFIDNGSSSLKRLLACDSICINVLSAEDGDFCRAFSRQKETRFQCGSWEMTPAQPPKLSRALAWLSGPIERSVIIGDHHLVVVQTEEIEVHAQSAQTNPLIFFRGSFLA